MIKILIAIIALAIPFATSSNTTVPDISGCVEEPPPFLYNFVKNTNPNLAEKDARYIAQTIQDKAIEYNIDMITFASIIRQESHFRLGLKVCQGIKGNCDRGLGQISSIWVKKWKLDTNRLQYDINYNIDISAQVIRHYIDKNPKDKRAYSRYYNGRPEMRRVYEKLVQKHAKVAIKTVSILGGEGLLSCAYPQPFSQISQT